MKTHGRTEEEVSVVEFDAVPISAVESKALVVPALRDQTSPFITCSRKIGSCGSEEGGQFEEKKEMGRGRKVRLTSQVALL